MKETEEQAISTDLCARCKQPVARDAARCARCGTPHKSSHRTTLWLGAGIGVAVLFVLGLMLYSIRQEDIANTPSPTEQSAPAQPDKPPPLNQ